jgi:hypothetical protein
MPNGAAVDLGRFDLVRFGWLRISRVIDIQLNIA